MKQVDIYRFLDIIEDIKKLEALIILHKTKEDDFMLSQYEAKKTHLLGILIDELVRPP